MVFTGNLLHMPWQAWNVNLVNLHSIQYDYDTTCKLKKDFNIMVAASSTVFFEKNVNLIIRI